MKDYWLTKLISSVTEVDSRKKLQKSIYLLQYAGCPLQLNYIFHYYGPYSFELAGLIDQLKGAGIIDESVVQTESGNIQYKSKISKKGKSVLANFQRSETGKKMHRRIKRFVSPFQDLNDEDPWVLELAATIAYFYEDDWEKAQKQTATFKKLPKNDNNLKQARKVAETIL